MAKLHKIEMYVLDVNDEYEELDDIINALEYKIDVNFIPFNSKTVKIDFHDDIDINHIDATIDNYENYFK